MSETDKIESPVGTRKRSYSFKRMETRNKKQRSVCGEPIAGSGGEVETTSPTGPMLDLQVDKGGQVASTRMDKSAPATSVNPCQKLEIILRNVKIWLDAAQIKMQDLTTERDSTLATLLLEKNNIESKLRKATFELAQQKKMLAIESAAVLQSKRTITQTLEMKLRSASEDVEVEKERRLCQICFEAQKDTISLPCLHLQYCFTCLDEHRKRSNTCPTCRMPISGVLKGDIWK